MWETPGVGVHRWIRVTALIGCFVLLLGCSFPNRMSKSDQESLVEWCFANGKVAVSCPQMGAQAAFLVNEMGYDRKCVMDAMKFYLRTGIEFDHSKRCTRK